MARRKRAAPAAAPVEESLTEDIEDAAEEGPETDAVMTTGGLQFDLPLTWRAGKPIAISDLLGRLQQLSQELGAIPQESADRESLVPKAQELASPQLLGHKDKGVKAWAMLCIVEMFRLLAPNAPYKAGQLKTIFDLFASSMVPALASPSDPYNQQHTSILQSLTSFKSIVLITDIPASDHLLVKLFTNCFDVLSGTVQGAHGETIPRNVEYLLTKMLVTIVEESDALPPEVPDIILAQFLRVDPHAMEPATKKTGVDSNEILLEPSPAYNMARSICNTCAHKMGPLVGSYFSAVLVDVSQTFTTGKAARSKGRKRTHDESEDEDDSMLTPPAEIDLGEVEKAHRLLRELWRSSPDVIHNVVEHLDIELSTENVDLRILAVQTVGDMIAGIGSAGPPPPTLIDPAAYPSESLAGPENTPRTLHPLLEARAPHAFSSVHVSTYQAFFSRHADRAASVRSAWATAAARIISTSGGGKGLDHDQELDFLRCFAQRLVDSDEKVRLAAVNAVAEFDFQSAVTKLGKSGSITTPDSVLANLAERIKDRNHNTRTAAMETLGRIWGAAAGSIAEGDEQMRELLSAAPSTILTAMYLNKPEINALVQRVLWESLLPIGYPPIKAKPNGSSQRVPDSQGAPETNPDPDAIRTERILVLVRDLQERARTVFFSILGQQNVRAKYVSTYIKECEAFAGGDCDAKSRPAIEARIDKLSEVLSKFTPQPELGREHLKAFAKAHDRRSYVLIGFVSTPDSNYKKVANALKELKKRLEDAAPAVAATADTVLALARTSAKLVYNKSHVPAIMEYAQTNRNGLGTAAQELLKELSLRDPDVFKSHVLELCNSLKQQVLTPAGLNDSSAVDTLKACAGFAQRFPKDMPDDRAFFQAMVAYARSAGEPKAAKHAVTIIVAAAGKKEMYIKDLIEYSITDFRADDEHVLAKLATLAQIQLIAGKDVEMHADAILDITVTKIIKKPVDPDEQQLEWKTNLDTNDLSKLLALKILVNGVRGLDTSGPLSEAYERVKPTAERVYKLLHTIIDREGELTASSHTPDYLKARLRLAAAIHLLRLSCNPVLDRFLRPTDFNDLTRIAQDPRPEVRHEFLKTLKKYLVQGKLPPRFYSLVFIYAFEPSKSVKELTINWLRGRGSAFAREEMQVMEGVFPRFLSVLAHHQDFSMETQDLEEFVEYLTFFLRSVATEENIAVLHHVAQRLKTIEDGIDPSKSNNLYALSDVAEVVIRQYCDIRGWSLQLYSGRFPLPNGIFARLAGHVAAQEISETRYAPAELLERLDEVVKHSLKPRKRKIEASVEKPPAKKAKSAAVNPDKKKTPSAKASRTPKKRTAADTAESSERRRSSRVSRSQNYAEGSDESEDDEDTIGNVVQNDDDDDNDDDEDVDEHEDENEMEVEEDARHDDGIATSSVLGEANKENMSAPIASDETSPTMNGNKRRKTANARSTPRSSTRRGAAQASSTRSRRAQAPAAKSGRKTRATRDIMDLPSDSDEELSDVPEGLAA